MKRAIAYFANGIGNFVMMMPALQALRELSGDSVDLCLPDSWRDSRRPAVEEIGERWPTIGRIFKWPTESFNPRDYGFWFYSNHSAGSEVTQVFLHNMKHRPVSRPAWRDSLMHEVDHYMEIVAAMGWVNGTPRIEFPVTPDPDLSDLKHPVVGLCNGAFNTPYWQKKHWPHFIELSLIARRYLRGSIIGIGNTDELAGVPFDRDLTGKLTITQSARAIAQCDLFISTDTGCMHVADAMGVSTIALFGSTLISKNGPRGKGSVALASGIDCAPCQDQMKFYHCQEALCMKSISVGDVIAAAKESLNGLGKSY